MLVIGGRGDAAHGPTSGNGYEKRFRKSTVRSVELHRLARTEASVVVVDRARDPALGDSHRPNGVIGDPERKYLIELATTSDEGQCEKS